MDRLSGQLSSQCLKRQTREGSAKVLAEEGGNNAGHLRLYAYALMIKLVKHGLIGLT